MGEVAGQPRELFGPFRVFERLGVGGSSTVHRATRAGDGGDVEVSLKRLHEHLGEKEPAVQSFLHEAELAARMNHANIARFYEVGRQDGAYFIAMEYIEGRSLRDLLVNAHKAEEPLPLAVTLSIVCQLCDAIEYLHNRLDDDSGRPMGLIHRDISPANVLVTPWGQVKLIDLGICKSQISEVKTGTGVIKGKYGYMAPEVLHGGETTKSVDIFAIGVVTWELLTAQRLFAGPSDLDTIERIKAGIVPAPSTRVAAYSPYLDDVVLRALHRNPGERWPTAAAMRTALQAVASMQHEPVDPTVISDWMRLGHRTPTPTPTMHPTDQTTQVIERAPMTMPLRPQQLAQGTREVRRFARGSDSVPAIRATTTKLAPPPAKHSRLAIVVAVSIAVNALLVAWIVGGLTESHDSSSPALVANDTSREQRPPTQPRGVRTNSAAPIVTPPPVAAKLPATRPPVATKSPPTRPPVATKSPPTRPPVATKPAPTKLPVVNKTPAKAKLATASLLTVDASDVRLRSGFFPRSRSTRQAYSARVCINRAGRVIAVKPLTGPPHLFRRVKRMLSYGRYAVYMHKGAPRAVCFVVKDRFRPWRARPYRR